MMDWVLPMPVIVVGSVIAYALAFWLMIEVAYWVKHRGRR